MPHRLKHPSHDLGQALFRKLTALLLILMSLLIVSGTFLMVSTYQEKYKTYLINSAGIQRALQQKYSREISVIISAHATQNWNVVFEQADNATKTKELIDKTYKGFSEGGDINIELNGEKSIKIAPLTDPEVKRILHTAITEWEKVKSISTLTLQSDVTSIVNNPRYEELAEQVKISALASDQFVQILQEQGVKSAERLIIYQVLTTLFGALLIVLILLYVKKNIAAPLSQTTAMLAEFSSQQNALMNNLPDLIWIKDSNHKFITCNTPFAEACNTTLDIIIGKTDYDFWPKELADKYRNDDEHVLKTGRRIETEEEFENSDGKRIWINTVKTPVRDNVTGKIIGTIGIGRDITETRQAMEDLKKSEKQSLAFAQEAEKANQIKSNFLANMSHEIRTPLNGILGMNQLLFQTALSPEQQDYCKSISLSGDLLLNIVNQILDLAKIEAGKLDLETIPFNLKESLEETVEMIGHEASKRAFDFSLHVSPTVPNVLLGDPGRICQIMINLLANAFKFTEQGSVTAHVSCLKKTETHVMLKFSVTDTGKGISPEKLGTLFDTFTQEDASTTRKYGGTGLGLAICKQLVNLMGGYITAESKLGEGSTFTFVLSLPIVQEKKMQTPIPPKKTKPKKTNRIDNKIRILLAEDNVINQKVAVRLLEKLGITVDVANNGREAIDLLRVLHYDMILMDCQMPEMDGYEATRTIRNSKLNQCHIPIIALTANVMKGDQEKCLAAGMNDYLPKPIHLGLIDN